MVEIKINEQVYQVATDYTLLQALEQAGIEVPRFCFHERLSIAGNCRMCLVELKGGAKPVASCALNIGDLVSGAQGKNIEIFTDTPMVKKAREGAMEFLLLNHPLDCPICDQGGECDLQDQAMAFGKDTSRYCEGKRSVEDKDFSPLIATHMTRCIHCTRCVRFLTEIAGTPELGMTGRGGSSEISTYIEQSIQSELQGNIIDLCPVGALTAKPYANKARSWELSSTDTIDLMDAVGSAIRIETRGTEIIRILPRMNEKINEEWISDKTRFIGDGLRVQRLDRPLIRGEDDRFFVASWSEAFDAIKNQVKKVDSTEIGMIAGDFASVEEMYSLKCLSDFLRCDNIDCRQDGAWLNPSLGRETYIFNPTIEGIEEADTILLIGCNPRLEAPLLNARIRKAWRKGRTRIALLGEKTNLLYAYDWLGDKPSQLFALSAGEHPFSKILQDSAQPLILIGQNTLSRRDGRSILAQTAKLALHIKAVQEGWNGFGVLHHAAARVGGLDVGFVPKNRGKSVQEMLASCKMLFLLGADECNIKKAKDAFIVYIGTHGDIGAQNADVILPGAAYTEKSGTYVNTEGRVQQTNRVLFPPGEAKEDWLIIKELSDYLGYRIDFNSLEELRNSLYAFYPHLKKIDEILCGQGSGIKRLAELEGHIDDTSLFSSLNIKNFYLTNSIARASPTMAKCSASISTVKPIL